MAQIFHRSTNTLSRVSIFGAVFIIAVLTTVISILIRSPYFTEARVVRVQPVPFSHKHHVSGIGIDCRYCHTSVEESSFAGKLFASITVALFGSPFMTKTRLDAGSYTTLSASLSAFARQSLLAFWDRK